MSTIVNEENLMTNQWQNFDESWTSIVYVLLPLQCGVILELIEIIMFWCFNVCFISLGAISLVY